MSRLGREEDIKNQKRSFLLMLTLPFTFIAIVFPTMYLSSNIYLYNLGFLVLFIYTMIVVGIAFKTLISDVTGVNEFVLIGANMDAIESSFIEIGFTKVKDGYYCPAQPSWGFFSEFEEIQDPDFLKFNSIDHKSRSSTTKMIIYKTTRSLMKPNFFLASKIRDKKVFIFKEFTPPEKNKLNMILSKIEAEEKYDISYKPTLKVE